MTLRLVGEYEAAVCQTCSGRGWVRCPHTYAVRGQNFAQPSGMKPVPCPECKGKKVVTINKEDQDERLHPGRVVG